jgi:hypothetical protein
MGAKLKVLISFVFNGEIKFENPIVCIMNVEYISGDHLTRINFPGLFQARITTKDIVSTPCGLYEQEVITYIFHDNLEKNLGKFNVKFPSIEVKAVDEESRFELTLESLPREVKWLTVEGVNVVLPHGGFPTHFEKIRFKNCKMRFVSFGDRCCLNRGYEPTLNDPGLQEFIMEGCHLLEADKLVFPTSLRSLDLSKGNTLGSGYPKNIIHCNLDSYLGIPEETSPFVTSLYWYRDLMRKKEREIRLNKYIQDISKPLYVQEHLMRLLRLSASDEPHAVIPCKRRTETQLRDDMINHEKNIKMFLGMHSPPKNVIAAIKSIDAEDANIKRVLSELEDDEIEFIISYQQHKADNLFILTGEGKYNC